MKFQRKLVLIFNNTDDKGEEDFKNTNNITAEEDRRESQVYILRK